ncbi:MAG: hypothetical protein KF845_08675 [Cyclobacteriaceae bacterium]|nr:hypothetical protein [Cyclobacteriaceae bacterium]
MKKYATLLLILTPHLQLLAQVIDLSKAASERKIEAVEYDGSYYVLPYNATKEMRAGLVGQEITIAKLSSSVKDKNGRNVLYKEKEIEGKVWVIKQFINDEFDGKFLIEGNGEQWIVELGITTDDWYINKGLENFKSKFIGKKYNAFIIGLEVESIDQSKIQLDGKTPITVKDIQYAKTSYTKYSIVLFFDNGLITQYDPTDIFQPKEDGWIIIGKYESDLLVEESILNKYIAANPRFIKQMREGNVEVGMTEHQTRLSWGMPQRTLYIPGYDKVNDYGYKKLYFKKNILQLIK